MVIHRSSILLLVLLMVTTSYVFEHIDASSNQQVVIDEVPVLMYHVIGNNNGSMKELYVNPDVFGRQMQHLYDHGYRTVTLAELYNHWEKGASLPSKPIVLTFDDGYKSVYNEAYPVMTQYGFKGVLFLYIDKFKYQNSLTHDQVAEMLAEGYEVGCHTYTHPDLTTCGAERLRKEVASSKAELENMFDIDVVSFCYPAGRYDNAVLMEVENAGFSLAVTTKYGYAKQEQGLFTLKRVRINQSDGLKGFIRKLAEYENR